MKRVAVDTLTFYGRMVREVDGEEQVVKPGIVLVPGETTLLSDEDAKVLSAEHGARIVGDLDEEIRAENERDRRLQAERAAAEAARIESLGPPPAEGEV